MRDSGGFPTFPFRLSFFCLSDFRRLCLYMKPYCSCFFSDHHSFLSDSDTLMAARSQPNDNWGRVGNGAKHGEKHVGGGSGM